jgi:molecular chaperone GrpE
MDKKDKKHGPKNGDEILEEILKAKEKKKVSDTELEREISGFRDEIELLRKELAHYKKLEEQYLDKLKRVHADYDNFRKRVIRDEADTVARANKRLIEKLLPVIDSFDQAFAMSETLGEGCEDFLKGVNMIYSKLMEILASEGVSVIDPHGQEFNPHECEVAVTADQEGAEEGTVLDVLRKGYRLNDFLIRPAVVKVCKK